jgi:hypothetical protein
MGRIDVFTVKSMSLPVAIKSGKRREPDARGPVMKTDDDGRN